MSVHKKYQPIRSSRLAGYSRVPPKVFVAGQDKSKSGRFSKSGRIYTQPAKTSKKFSAAGGCKGGRAPIAGKIFGF